MSTNELVEDLEQSNGVELGSVDRLQAGLIDFIESMEGESHDPDEILDEFEELVENCQHLQAIPQELSSEQKRLVTGAINQCITGFNIEHHRNKREREKAEKEAGDGKDTIKSMNAVEAQSHKMKHHLDNIIDFLNSSSHDAATQEARDVMRSWHDMNRRLVDERTGAEKCQVQKKQARDKFLSKRAQISKRIVALFSLAHALHLDMTEIQHDMTC